MHLTLARILTVGLFIGLLATGFATAPVRAADRTLHLYGTVSGWGDPPGTIGSRRPAHRGAGWADAPGTIGSPGPTLRVDVGDNVTILAHREDSFTHNWYLDLNGDASWDAGEPRTDDIDSAVPRSVTFNATTAGTYTYYCEYHQGTMRGQFIVQAPSTTPPAADNTLLYAGIGIVAVVAVVVAALAMRGRKKA